MRYILLLLILFATGCSGQSTNNRQGKIDTAKLFNPNNHPYHAGAKQVDMFRRNIALTQPDFYVMLNDSEYKFETLKKLSDFIKTNKSEIQKDLFYLLTDSNTAFKKIVSTIDALTENQITDYKVINVQEYFTPPEPVTIQAPTSVVTTTKINDSTFYSRFFCIEIFDKGINVKLKGEESKLKNTDDLDLFVAAHKPDIKEIFISMAKEVPNSKFLAVFEVLKKHELYKIILAPTK